MPNTTQKKIEEHMIKGYGVVWEIVKGTGYFLDQRSINERKSDTKLWLKQKLGKNGIIVPVTIIYGIKS